jgi:shikimate dehydrogenase
MHNAALAHLGLDWVYVPLPVRSEEVGTAVAALPTLNFRGVNVTVPHKQAVMPFLDEVEAGARAIGAVNTIVVRRSGGTAEPGSGGERRTTHDALRPQLHGHNTDWTGFLADLQEHGVAVAGRDCLILGAGGSARAVAYGFARQGARVTILARRVEQAEEVVNVISSGRLTAAPLTELATVVANMTAPLIINSTPLGMTPQVEASIWPDDLPLPVDVVLYDLVYNPIETKLLRQGQAAGCQTINGLGMLIHQGAEAFRLWTGQQPDLAVMREAVQRHVYGKS